MFIERYGFLKNQLELIIEKLNIKDLDPRAKEYLEKRKKEIELELASLDKSWFYDEF